MPRPHALLPALALITCLALPASAQIIPAGNDYWATPATGNTYMTLPTGDLESLCGAPADPSWDHVIRFRGVPVFADADTIVRRLDSINLPVGASTSVRVQVTALRFEGLTTTDTPCGTLTFAAGLLEQQQPITKMRVTRTSTRGGVFASNLQVRVQIIASYADTGTELGRLYYTFDLPDPGTTVWSYGGVGGWRPAVSTTNDCFAVARAKIATFPDPAYHEYFISQYQAQGICPRGVASAR
jgi:hypothetical protein